MKTLTLTLTIPTTLSTIGVIRDLDGIPTELRIFPVTPGYPVIYYPCTEASVSPELPQQVEWTVHELHEGEAIAIQKKRDSPHVFEWDAGRKTIESTSPQLNSGFPLPPSGRLKQTLAWVYSIELTSPRLAKSIKLDPVIIIEPDPK